MHLSFQVNLIEKEKVFIKHSSIYLGLNYILFYIIYRPGSLESGILCLTTVKIYRGG